MAAFAEQFGTAMTQVTEQFGTAVTQVTGQITHFPRGDDRQVDLESLLRAIKDIINRGIPTLSGNANVTQAQAQAQMEASNKMIFNVASEELKMIRTISCEISCNCSGVDTTTKTVGEKLSSYPRDAQLVIALASFAVNYSEFCLATELYQLNPFAKFVGLLKQVQSKLGFAARPWKSEFETLIKDTLAVTECIACLDQIPSKYTPFDTAPFLTAINSYASNAISPAIRGIIICAKIISIEPGSQITETIEELYSLATKMRKIYTELSNELKNCIDRIESEIVALDKKYKEFLENFRRIQVNVDVVNALINTKDRQLLFDGSKKTQVSVEVLKGKEVLLLISDLDISDLALSNLCRFYEESRKGTQYEVVWVPVAEYLSSTTKKTLSEQEKKFKDKQGSMAWHSLTDFSFVKTIALRYIKEEWKFNKESLFVKLSPSGEVMDIYPISKVWLWGSFFGNPGISLTEASWNIKLLAGHLISSDKIKDGKYICLYGGEDKDWIQRFTAKAKNVAQAASIQLEMVYVGHSNLGNVSKIREVIEFIQANCLSETIWPERAIWLFWARLESMWRDNVEQGKTMKDDPIMWELMRTLYCFGGSHQGWAVISEGSVNLAKANGDIIVKCLDQFNNWKADWKKTRFVSALNGYIKKLLAAHHCVPLVLPSTITDIPDEVFCPECLSPMKRFNMYRCCT